MSALLIALLAAAPSAVSLDFCADQYLLKLADREQITALSPDAEKDFSYLRSEAKGLKKRRPDAEYVLGAKADIAIRFWGGDTDQLERLGVQVVTLDYATDFEGVYANIEKAADALGRTERGAELVSAMKQRLQDLQRRNAPELRALYVTPGGVTAGANTMIDAIMSAGGVINLAATPGSAPWPPLPAEIVVLAPPALIVTGFFDAQSEKVSHWSAARHPAFRTAFSTTQVVHLRTDQISCPGWFSLDAAEAIAAGTEQNQ